MAKTVHFVLNGQSQKIQVAENELLIDVIRDKLKLTGTKKSCGDGECGACTVLINGEPVRSCIYLALMADGKNVTTIEGIGDENNLHPLQQSFINEGAIQCGFCTPGMILTAKALLDKNCNPDEDAIKDALSGNLCRCTGYQKILKAVKSASINMSNNDST